MSRYAPTLFIGLGGSGVKVLRWLRHAISSEHTESKKELEPVAFLGIDFDPSSNKPTEKLPALEATEFRYYDPASIAATVGNIDRERIADEEEGEKSGKTEWEFPEIRDWYPDPEQNSIRYAQSEATGAAQWRPLGRVGYFRNDREIHDAIAEALTDLDRRRGITSELGTQPTVILTSSIAGGTGSAILFDVAVAVRKIRRGISVRAFLMLPELFDQIDFRDRVFPNAYATLWEVAALKNQHVIFNARYPRTPPVTSSDSPPPFQRVFLVGPWVGERKPFREPDDVFPFVALLLRTAATPEIRAAALTAEANASADSGAPLSDRTSLHVFCAMSAMAIRLLSYAELADLVMGQLLEELKPEGERPLLDILLPGRMKTDPVRPILDWIETAASGKDGAYEVTETYRNLELNRFIRGRDSYRSLWRKSDLEKLRQDLRRFCGTDPSAPMDEPPELLRRIREEFSARLEERIRELGEQFGDTPRALEGFLARFERQLPERRKRKPHSELQNIDNFEQWLETGRGWGSLAQQLTPARLDRLHDEAHRWLKSEVPDSEYRLWQRQAVETGARDVIRKLREEEEARWTDVDALRDAAKEELTRKADTIEDKREQVFLDGRSAKAVDVMRRELARFDASRARDFHRTLMSEFLSFYEDYRVGDTVTIRRWIDTTRKLFERQLGAATAEEDAGSTHYRLVSPSSLFSDDAVTSAMLRCRTHVFQSGRVSSPAALRIARLLVPDGFRDRTGYALKMRNWSKGLLNASTSSLSANGSGTENRIIVVVEDLFHPAEDIVGIYDYYSHYSGQENKLLFHIHRLWPGRFPALITRAGDRSRVTCGNLDCNADIRTLPHTELFCPKCDRPIHNRCGNGDCMANNLAERPDRDQFIEARTCPTCRRFLHTSWWKCPEHGDVPIDKPNCPHCVRSGRALHQIHARPDRLHRFTCPVCTSRNLPSRFTARGDAARFLVDGVNGHDVLKAETELGTILNRGAFCPHCATQLAPLCPLPDPDHPNRHHYLYRHPEGARGNRFRCYLHPEAVVYTCAQCQFPNQGTESRCKRCESELADCRYCTPIFGIRIPVRSDQPLARCPNCFTIPLVEGGVGTKPPVRDAQHDDLYCSNLFGCPAGGRLNDTTFPAHTAACPFCHNEDLPLLETLTREEHITACRFCSKLFGLTYRGRPRDGHCCLCGRSYPRAESEDPPEAHVTISCVLRCTADDEEAFRKLLAHASLKEAPLRITLIEFLKEVERKAVRCVLEPRLERIVAFYDRQFGCRSDPVRHGSGSCDC